MAVDDRIAQYLNSRKENHLYRQLSSQIQSIDFTSNDYLGLTRSSYINQEVKKELESKKYPSGATGSRLLSGNSIVFNELEVFLAEFYHAESALLFNSGFDANVGLISTVAQKGDVIFYDELVHASIHQGMRLSGAELVKFSHNNWIALEESIKQYAHIPVKFLIVESVYSMEGDQPDFKKLLELTNTYGLSLIVDEAHANGLFGSSGSGLCNQYGIEKDCFARVYTFGKAMGSHGAVVVGSKQLIEYLINFSKNFIYSTALDISTLIRVKHSYLFIQKFNNQLFKLNYLIKKFKNLFSNSTIPFPVCGEGPIFGLIVGDNQKCRQLASYLQAKGFDIRPILSPTVPKGTERLRVIIHSFNTEEEIEQLYHNLTEYQ